MSGCLYFGCWKEPGHILIGLDGRAVSSRHPAVRFVVGDETIHIDGSLAPRLSTKGIVWAAQGRTDQERIRIDCRSEEAPQGQFLRHELPNGYTAIQWWDRQQGDERGGSNSSILMEGKRDSAELIAALDAFFPNVRANLVRGGVQLVEVFP